MDPPNEPEDPDDDHHSRSSSARVATFQRRWPSTAAEQISVRYEERLPHQPSIANSSNLHTSDRPRGNSSGNGNDDDDPDVGWKGKHLWPSARLLAEYIALHENIVQDAVIVELGAGVGLPSLTVIMISTNNLLTPSPKMNFLVPSVPPLTLACSLYTTTSMCVSLVCGTRDKNDSDRPPTHTQAGKLGARCVYMTDSTSFPDVLALTQYNIALNDLVDRCQVLPWTWGQINTDILTQLPAHVDLILGADVFYRSVSHLRPTLPFLS